MAQQILIPQRKGPFEKLGPIGNIASTIVSIWNPAVGAAISAGTSVAKQSEKNKPQAQAISNNSNVYQVKPKDKMAELGGIAEIGSSIYNITKASGSSAPEKEQYKGDIPEGDSAIDRRLQFQQDDFGKQLEESRQALAYLPEEQRKLYEAPILQAYQKYQYGNRRV